LAGTLSVANSSYTYDTVGRLTNLIHQHGASTLASYGLVYDAVNRITRSSGTDGVQDYVYDSTNQLTGVDHSTQADEAYSYDANGNRTSGGSGTGTNNQLLTDGVYNYAYDGEGNRTKRVEIATGKVTEYVWDYRNRLTSVLFKDVGGVITKTIEYLYDGNNQRIGKRIDGAVTERYVIGRNQIGLGFDGAGIQTHRYLYGTGVDTVLADESGGAVVWALSDNQGTVKDLIDNVGNAVSHINYDSFGRVVSQTGSVDFRYGYTGREQDAETGLDYYRARYYDARNGRFISEDPIGFAAGDANLTRYVGNSPVNGTDPSGLQPIPVKPPIPVFEPLPGGKPGGNPARVPRPIFKPKFPIIEPDRNPFPNLPQQLPYYKQPTVKPAKPFSPSDDRGFTREQEEVLANRRAKVTQYKDRLRVDDGSCPDDPNKCKRKCYTFELPFHLGGPPESKGSRYASYTSGSPGDFLIFAPSGNSAFFDGLVRPGGEFAERYGVSTNRHVIEAKAWNYGGYSTYIKTRRLVKLLSDVSHDRLVASQCKYTYSVVTSSPTLIGDFRRISTQPIYNISWRGDT
jgi:RHS repeat-associated protein